MGIVGFPGKKLKPSHIRSSPVLAPAHIHRSRPTPPQEASTQRRRHRPIRQGSIVVPARLGHPKQKRTARPSLHKRRPEALQANLRRCPALCTASRQQPRQQRRWQAHQTPRARSRQAFPPFDSCTQCLIPRKSNQYKTAISATNMIWSICFRGRRWRAAQREMLQSACTDSRVYRLLRLFSDFE